MLGLRGEVIGGAHGPDSGVASHFGDPMREQRMLAAGRAVVDLPFAAVTVSGRDRLSWLDTLSSQRLRDLPPGETTELLLLDIHGRIEHQALVTDDAAAQVTYLVTEATTAPELVRFLDSMRFMLDVSVAIAQDFAVLGYVRTSAGEGTSSAVGDAIALATAADSALAPVLLADPWPGVVPGGTRYSLLDTDDDRHPGHDTRFMLQVVRADAVDAVIKAVLAGSAGSVAGMLAWESLRVAAWRPRAGRELDEKSLPHELDLLRTAVHLTKGCYRGQEGVARTFNLGRPPRRLVFLHLDGSEHLTPEVGADVGFAGRTVGHVTSVVRHYELGPVALAVLKRSVPIDVDLEVAGPGGAIAASQEVIVGADGYGEGRPEARGPVTPGLRRRS